jgi:hypothetical protein
MESGESCAALSLIRRREKEPPVDMSTAARKLRAACLLGVLPKIRPSTLRRIFEQPPRLFWHLIDRTANFRQGRFGTVLVD